MTIPSQTAESRVGSVIAGRYRIEKVLGAGGMGAVYAGSGPNNQRVALKLLLENRFAGDAGLVARFLREAKLATSVQAPNVVRTYECLADPETGQPVIAMELLDGRDADDLVRTLGPIEPKIAVRIILQAARGIREAHAAGVVHRDIKPSNIFLSREHGQIIAKVCDFGIAKAVETEGDASLTATGSPLGTPLYLSPEQMRDAKRVDVRTDVWSLAMALWTLLAGYAALEDSESLSELYLNVLSKDTKWIQDAASWVDPGLARVLHGGLFRDVEKRCPTIQAFIDGLQPFTGGTEAIFESDLSAVSAQTRLVSAGRAERASSWHESIPSPVSADEPALHALVGQGLAGGRYRIERMLGSGGMGAVFQAIRAADGQRVAVKVIHGDRQKPDMLRRFVREARTTTAVQSPNVVRVLDVDTDGERGLPFIVMELLDGIDLDKLVRQSGALEPQAVAKTFLQVCAGLGAAHARGVLHRDVKPANLLLHREADGRITIKICDFGIAKQVHDEEHGGVSTELTRTGGVLGSPMYMSPEQARSAKHVDQTTDVWSVGASLYEALSGRRLWDGQSSVGDLIVAICTQEPTPILDLAPWVDPRFAAVVHRSLSRDPSQRFPSMAAFADALAPFAGPGRELLAAPPQPVPPEIRAKAAHRSHAGGTVAMGSRASATPLSALTPPAAPISTDYGAASTASRARKSSVMVPLIIGGAILFLGAAVAIGWTVRSQRLAPKDAVPTATVSETVAAAPSPPPREAPSLAPATTKHAVSLRIMPPDAQVIVDGKPATSFTDGVLTVDAEPGEEFVVVAKVGTTRSITQKLFVNKEGKGSFDKLEVPPAALPGKPPPPPTPQPNMKKEPGHAPPPPQNPSTTTTPVGANTF